MNSTGRSVGDWLLRLNMANAALKQVNAKHPGRKVIVSQIRRINERLVLAQREERAARGEPEPEPIVIKMQALKLKGRAVGIRGA